LVFKKLAISIWFGQLTPKAGRRNPEGATEQANEIGNVLDAHLFGDLHESRLGCKEQTASGLHFYGLQGLVGGEPVVAFECAS
jgi:hypothetical protein